MKKFTNDQKNANWNDIFVFIHHLWQNKTQDWLYPSLIRIWGERCIIHCWWEQTPGEHLEWKFSITEGPQLMRVWHKIFWLYNGSNAINIQQKLYFKFWTWVIPWASHCGTKLSRDAGQRQRVVAPSQAYDHECKRRLLNSVFVVLDD